MAYDPPPGTIPAKVIAHLRSLPPGTRLRTAELVAAIGLELGPNAGLHNFLTTAVKHGIVVQHPDPSDKRRALWWLGDGTAPEHLKVDGEDDADAPLTPRTRKPKPEQKQLDQLIAAGAPAVDAAIEKLVQQHPVDALKTAIEASGQQVDPAVEQQAREVCDQPVPASPDPELVSVCCGEFEICTRPCTPRGVHIGRRDAHGTALIDVPGYEALASVLIRAYAQAADGKGAERHAQGQPFHEQPMQQLIRLYGLGFALGQAAKKAQEAPRLPTIERQVAELLGAINYLAGAVIALEAGQSTTTTKD